MIDLSSFNVIEYLQEIGIAYTERGKNVSNNWIGIQCPFPTCGDRSNHCGINLTTKAFSCLKCGEKGSMAKLIMELENKSFPESMEKAKKFIPKDKYGNLDKQRNVENYSRASEKELRTLFERISVHPTVLDFHREYLESRGFNPLEIENTYGIRSCKPGTRWCQRLAIPYTVRGNLLTFSTRDVSGKAKIPYKHCPATKSISVPKEMLFNVDTVKDTCIVVEGVFDVFRIGPGSVAVSGTQYTRKQILLLSKFKRIFLLFDPENTAQKIARRFANDLSFSSSSLEIILLKYDKDPGEMPPDDVKVLRKEVFGRIY